MSPSIARKLNLLGLSAISFILLFAFIDQVTLHDLPCPLCLLQRAAFAGAGIGLALNVRFGTHSSHYALILISAVVGTALSARQILLHIVPGTGSYGHIIFGMHFYTWAFALFLLIIVGIAGMLMFDSQFCNNSNDALILSRKAVIVIVFFVLLVFCNVISTFLECGGGLCVSNPVTYELLDKQ